MDKCRDRIDKPVKDTHSASCKVYGYRKIQRRLVQQGLEQCCAGTVRKAMQQFGIRSRRGGTTNSDHNRPVAENLLERGFSASAPTNYPRKKTNKVNN